MRFKKSPQLPGAGRTRAWHHHGSHTPTSPGAISLGKVAYHTKQISRKCKRLHETTNPPSEMISSCYANRVFVISHVSWVFIDIAFFCRITHLSLKLVLSKCSTQYYGVI